MLENYIYLQVYIFFIFRGRLVGIKNTIKRLQSTRKRTISFNVNCLKRSVKFNGDNALAWSFSRGTVLVR